MVLGKRQRRSSRLVPEGKVALVPAWACRVDFVLLNYAKPRPMRLDLASGSTSTLIFLIEQNWMKLYGLS